MLTIDLINNWFKSLKLKIKIINIKIKKLKLVKINLK